MVRRSPDAPAREHRGQRSSLSQRLNWLRAGVLGANDGIVSIAGLVVGVAGATTDRGAIMIAGIAGLLAGAVSMALGEYVSVSSQRDTERALIAQERAALDRSPDDELRELTALYIAKGASAATAERLARELTAKDAFAAHLDVELGLDPGALVSPWQAAASSAAAFVAGSVLPLVSILVPPAELRIPVTFASVLVALAITGAVSARLGGARSLPAVSRLVLGGAGAMAVTFGIGRLVGVLPI